MKTKLNVFLFLSILFYMISAVTAYADPNTVALYRFDTMHDDDDNSLGEYVVDDSGNDLNFKREYIYGSLCLSQDIPTAAPSGSLSIHSIGSHLDTPETDLLSIGQTGEITIEFWFKPVAVTTINYILTQEAANNFWCIYEADCNGNTCAIAFYTKNNLGTVKTIKTGTIFSKDGGWNHVAVTVKSNGDAEIFKNGISAASGSGFSNYSPYTSILRLGSDDVGNWAGTFFMDDLRISNRALPVGDGNGIGEMAWSTSLSNAPDVQRSQTVAKDWVRTHPFTISSWGASSDIDMFSDANFNSALGGRSSYQTTAGAGITNHILGGFHELDEEGLNIIHIATHAPLFQGWLLCDEIPPADINGVADVADYIKTVDSNNVTYAGFGSSGETYIDNVINTIGPDVLIHAWYQWANQDLYTPLGIDLMEGHYYDMNMFRSKALENNLTLFYYIQSFSDHLSETNSTPVRYLPSESQLRSDLFVKLAIGVKGFVYFVFDKTNGGPLMDEALYNSVTHTTSDLYTPAMLANREVANLGASLRFLKSTDIRFVRGKPDNWAPAAIELWSIGAGGDTYIKDINVVEQGATKDGFIGYFTDDANETYFMLVNTYQDTSLSTSEATLHYTMDFDFGASGITTLQRLRRDTGNIETVSLTSLGGTTYRLTLELPGGTGELFKFNTGEPFVLYPSPSNGANRVSIITDLSWCPVVDANITYDIYFGTSQTNVTDANHTSSEFKSNQAGTTYDVNTLSLSTTYYWRIDEVNDAETTKGNIWSFTTAAVPGKAIDPFPSNSDTGISITTDLSWTADANATSHDVYFGTDSTPDETEFKGNQAYMTSYNPNTLNANTTYYWRIDEVGPGGTTTGDVWNFTTIDRYTEKFQDITIGTASTWTDVDLTSYGVTAGQVVEIGIRNSSTSTARDAGVRIKGSSLARTIVLHAAATAGWDMTTMTVKTDANKKIQAYAANISDVHFYLVGIWNSGDYTEKFQTLTIGTTGSWVDSADLSTYGVAASQVVEVMASKKSTTAYIAGIRANGSSLDRKLTLHASTSRAADCLVMQAQADANRKIEVWKGNTSVTFTLLGYWTTAPGAYTEKFVDVGKPTSSATWYTRSLSGQSVPAYGICEMLIANASTTNHNNVGVRKVGSSLSRLFDIHKSSASTARECGMMHVVADSSSQIQQYLQNQADTVNFYLLGYWN